MNFFFNIFSTGYFGIFCNYEGEEEDLLDLNFFFFFKSTSLLDVKFSEANVKNISLHFLEFGQADEFFR